MYCEDVDLAFRSQLLGYRCVYVPTAVVYHMLSATGGGPLASYYCGRNFLRVIARDMPGAAPAASLAAGSCWRSFGSPPSRCWHVREPAARAKLRGQLDGLRELPRLLGERRAIQQRRRVPDPLPALDHGGAVTTASDPRAPPDAARSDYGRRLPSRAGRGAGDGSRCLSSWSATTAATCWPAAWTRCWPIAADLGRRADRRRQRLARRHAGDGRRAVPRRPADRQRRERRLRRRLQPGVRGRPRGRYLLVLNQDIAVRPGALRALVEFAEAHPEAGAVGAAARVRGRPVPALGVPIPGLETGVLRLLRRARAARQRDQRPLPAEQLERPFAAEHLLGACLLLRREALEQVGAVRPGVLHVLRGDGPLRPAPHGRLAQLLLPGGAGRCTSAAASTSAASEKMSVAVPPQPGDLLPPASRPGGYALLKADRLGRHRLPARSEPARVRARPHRRGAAPRADRRLLEDSVVLTEADGVDRRPRRATDLLDVSVVIVNYKVRDLLRDCLRSLEHDLGEAPRRGLGRRQRLRRRLGRDGRRPSSPGSG